MSHQTMKRSLKSNLTTFKSQKTKMLNLTKLYKSTIKRVLQTTLSLATLNIKHVSWVALNTVISQDVSQVVYLE